MTALSRESLAILLDSSAQSDDVVSAFTDLTVKSGFRDLFATELRNQARALAGEPKLRCVVIGRPQGQRVPLLDTHDLVLGVGQIGQGEQSVDVELQLVLAGGLDQLCSDRSSVSALSSFW